MQTEANHPTPSRLLVVDADGAVRSALKRLLEGAGCEVQLAKDARAGADLLSSGSTDLAIIDLDTFANDGASLLEQFCRPEALYPILVLSRTAGASDGQEAAKIGGFLVKPIDARVLLETVGSLLKRHQAGWHAPRSEAVALVLRRLQARGARFLRCNLPYRLPLRSTRE
jgi:DNA-binding response OmpR family regulator